jgi:hypothetical protein
MHKHMHQRVRVTPKHRWGPLDRTEPNGNAWPQSLTLILGHYTQPDIASDII